MNYDDDSRSESSSSVSDSSDPDLATVLTQMIRRGRAHILSERNLSLDERPFGASAMAPITESKQDLKPLMESDIHLATSLSAGMMTKQAHNKQALHFVHRRQLGVRNSGAFTRGDRSYLGHNYLPNEFQQVANYNHKMFCGTFSKDGDVFLSASQDRVIRVFDTSKGRFSGPLCIQAQDVGWAILDTAFSPSGRQVIYSSWSESVHLCDLTSDVQRHEVLPMNPEMRRFCIFSLAFSHDGHEVLGGANDGCLYVYDCEARRRTLRILAHDDDVNAVAYADETSHILFSGADDGLCKVWDRRTLDESAARPVGIFAGHVDGLTFIDSRGDGRHLITNSKDQSIKLWDMRKFSSTGALEQCKEAIRRQNWDYRWQNVPWRLALCDKQIKGDTSLMTYRGHSVLQTLIRCHFSPQFSTGQRYIYTGCAAGRVLIYDLLTGKQVASLLGHTACVRDVSWHPYKMEIVDTAWDGRHYMWFYISPDSELADLPFDSSDVITDSDSDSDDDRFSWTVRQRMDQRDENASAGDLIRRSPRLAAQRRTQPQPKPARTSLRRTRPPQ